jgi:hypothetical protein
VQNQFNSEGFWELIEKPTSTIETNSGSMTTASPLSFTTVESDYGKRSHRNTKRAARRKDNKLTFIGVDGEGVSFVMPDGSEEHRYVMLSVGDQTLWENGRELTHLDIFPFLYDQFRENPHAAYVGFFLGYDFALWLKSLPAYKGHKLLHPAGIAARKPKGRGKNPRPFPVDCDGWEFDILPNLKRFMLRPATVTGEKSSPWLYICDTGPFHQSSFMTVIEPSEKNWPNGTAPCSQSEYDDIAAGKNRRADRYAEGDHSYYAEMVRYNCLENDILGRVMATLNEGFVSAGVKLPSSRWFGPGQAIQVWLNDQVKEHGLWLTHEQMEESVPEWALATGQAAYYGGRFELFAHGHVPGPSFEYDITSAYPDAMRNLPCLCTNNWTGGAGDEDIPKDTDVVYVRGKFVTTNPSIGPLPLRTPKGHILYPNETTGWYLLSELDAAHEAGLLIMERIDEWICHFPCGHPSPLAGVADLYELRKKVGKGTPLGKALKLLFNSAYGKFAQSVGSPRFGNPIYASMITSSCRTKILHAIGTHPDPVSLLMVATDAVYFRTPHPGLDVLDNASVLGGWEPGRKMNLTLMKPGVYWDDKARSGGFISVKSRGISARALADRLGELDSAFWHVLETGCEEDLPYVLDMLVPFSIISPRLALARGKWEECGRVVTNAIRSDTVRLSPKRAHLYRDGDMLRSELMRVPPGIESTLYERRFGFDPEDLADELLTGDGAFQELMEQLMPGVRDG